MPLNFAGYQAENGRSGLKPAVASGVITGLHVAQPASIMKLKTSR
jgi:hypothetical protein